MPKVSQVIEQLKGYDPDSYIATAIWSVEDVIGYAQNDMDGIELSKDQAEKIIDDIDRHHDCELGITWMSIRCAIEDMEGERVEAWRCDVCGKVDKDPDLIFTHVMEDHNYPEEDAHLSTRPCTVIESE